MREFRVDKVPFERGSRIEDLCIDYTIPLDIEIGAGVGLHPINYSKNNPERNLVAIEHTKNKFDKFLRRYENHSLTNLFPIHANAISWVSNCIHSSCVDKFIFMYPNPNPKNSQKNKRWINMPFFSIVIDRLKEGGIIFFATNEQWYAQEVGEVAKKTWGLNIEYIKQVDPHINGRTHFERKYLSRGEPCWDIKLSK